MKITKKMISCFLVIVMVFSSVFVYTACGKKGEDGLIKVRVCEVTHSIFYAPQYVALAKGYFKDAGLEIELSNGGGADKVMAAVLSNNIDIGFAGPESCIYVYNEGRDNYPKVFAQLTKCDGSFLISREPSDNFSWNDLKGKTVIPGRKGGVPYMTLSHVLRENGLTPGVDVTLDDSIQFDLMAGAFSNGLADYVTLFEPTASAIVENKKGYYATSIGKESGEIPYTSYFATQKYMQQYPEVIQKFTDAIAKAQQWVYTHTPREIAETISEFFPDTSIDALETGIKNYMYIDAYSSSPEMKQEVFENLENVMIEAGELSEKVPFDQIVTNQFAKAVHP